MRIYRNIPGEYANAIFKLTLEISKLLVGKGFKGGCIDYALFSLQAVLDYIFCNSGFSCAGWRRDNHRMSLFNIIYCLLLKAVVKHTDIIRQISEKNAYFLKIYIFHILGYNKDMKRSKIWYIYFWAYIFLGLFAIYNVIQLKLPFQLIRATIFWLPAPVGLYLFISGKKFPFHLFWKLYFIYYIADIIYEWFWVKNFLSTELYWQLSLIIVVYVIEVLFLLPSIGALFNVAFKKD